MTTNYDFSKKTQTPVDKLMSRGVPFRAAIDFRTIDWKLKNGVNVDESWMKRYNDIKTKYNLI